MASYTPAGEVEALPVLLLAAAAVPHVAPVAVGELELLEVEQLVPDVHDVAAQRVVQSPQLVAPVRGCMLPLLQMQLQLTVVVIPPAV